MRVLIVEDEPYMAEAIRDGLRLEAIAADIAGDGGTAVDLVSVKAYDRRVLNQDIPALWGSGRAFAQATWRHLLFGAVLGEVERRLNPPDTEPRPVDAVTAASNGHGSAEYVVSLN